MGSCCQKLTNLVEINFEITPRRALRGLPLPSEEGTNHIQVDILIDIAQTSKDYKEMTYQQFEQMWKDPVNRCIKKAHMLKAKARIGL